MTRRVVVTAIGNEFRRDDGVALVAMRLLADSVPANVELVASDGEPSRLIEAWDGADLAVVIDAARSAAAAPGAVRRVQGDQIASRRAAASTHAIGLADALRLAAALHRLPKRMIVHTVEAGDTSAGRGLSREVAAALPELVRGVLADVGEAQPVSPRRGARARV